MFSIHRLVINKAMALGIGALLFGSFHTALAQEWSDAYFRGTPNDWGLTPMTYNPDSGHWETTQTFDDDNPRFKISRYDNWSQAYPAEDYPIVDGAGTYDIAFDDTDHSIEVSIADTTSDDTSSENTRLCFDNAQGYSEPHLYYWNASPADALNEGTDWPGLAMNKEKGFYCVDLVNRLNSDQLPDSLNVIFNDNGAAQTADLLFDGAPCYAGDQWQSLTDCGLDEHPDDAPPPIGQTPDDLDQRPTLNEPHALPVEGNVSEGNYRFEIAYPGLIDQFASPVMTLPDPVSGLMMVVDKSGQVYAFPDDPEVAPDQVRSLIDIEDQVKNYHEQGLLSMALDPDYASNGFIYLYYIQGADDNERTPDGQYGDAVLERWTIDNPANPAAVLDDSARELLRVEQPGPDHKGGMMQFHPEEGYLYLGIGDGAYGHSATTSFDEDPRTNNNAQVTSNLLGTFIRIEPLTEAENGKYYRVPDDNPFVDQSGYRPEIWSYGHRNPWRWAFDTEAPYTLWETEVGQSGYEEVNRVEPGKNYGWPVCEGLNNRGELGGDPLKDCTTAFEPPIEGYEHPTGYSIIGGLVYRGNQLPGLNGRFVFGDYVTKKIWAVAEGEEKTVVSDAFPENIASFGTDLSGDELLVSTYGVEFGGNSTIYRLVDDDADSAALPDTLSATGLFQSLSPLVPESGVIPYKVNTEGWFDGATVQHFLHIPNDETIAFADTEQWDLPTGSVLIKHKCITDADGEERPFTTEILFRQANGTWQAVNYHWNAEGTEATRVTETLTLDNTDAEGRTRTVRSSADCGSCHVGNGSREPLALHSRQLNRSFSEQGENQLDIFNRIGLFDTNIGAAEQYTAFASLEDENTSLEARARAYLDTNCAHCHNSDFMNLRYDQPLEDMRLLNVQTTGGKYRIKPFDHGESLIHLYQVTDGNRMPKGTRYTNPAADTLFAEWIDAVDAQPTGLRLLGDTRVNPDDTFTLSVEARYDNGFTAPVSSIDSVNSSDESVLSVEAIEGNQVTLNALSAGAANVTLSSNGQSTSLEIEVVSIDTSLTGLAISPETTALTDQQQLVAYGLGPNNTKIHVHSEVQWQVISGGDVVSVSDTGLVQRLAPGEATVRATLDEFSAQTTLTEADAALSLRYDNPDDWDAVNIYLWTSGAGEDQPLHDWPGEPMDGPDDSGWWVYHQDPDALPEGQLNVIFNNGAGAQTDDLNDIQESASYSDGQWEPWNAHGDTGGETYRLSVIGGSTENAERDFTPGTVVSIAAHEAPLGTEFSGWQGEGRAYVVGNPAAATIELVMPAHNVSIQALFAGQEDDYQAGRDFYGQHCQSCHGDNGEGGVAGAINALDDTWNQNLLASYIADFMPMDNPGACDGEQSGDCAFEIARLVLADAWQPSLCTDGNCGEGTLDSRNLRLLTKEEYLNSVRDVFNINFSAALMDTVPADGRYRNFTTASYLSAGYDRTLGYQLVASEIAEQAITRYTFMGLAEQCDDAACAVEAFGKRLFRRPLTQTEVDNYAALYDNDDGGRRALQALLMSPHFMYRSELGELDGETGLFALDAYETVTSLAYIFWATTPDDTLLAMAADEDFSRSEAVNHVLSDPRSERGLRRFISGWLINNQYGFPGIDNPDLVEALKEETVRFVLANIESNAPYAELLLAPYTQANDLVAEHYGLPDTTSGGWSVRAYDGSDPRLGAGLLGHASFLASRTNTVNPSPIKRGVYVRESLMCQEFPPPAAADFNVEFEDSDSNRDATERHTNDPACAACHQFIDGVGFGFERFDSQGLYRAMETLGNGETEEIDASGSIKSLYSPETTLDPDSEAVTYHSIPELAQLIAESGQGEACFARQFYRYVVGREESGDSDELNIQTFSQDLRNGGGMRDMLRDLVLSDSFIQRR